MFRRTFKGVLLVACLMGSSAFAAADARWSVGMMGSAYEVRLKGRTPVAVEVRTELPVMSYAGKSVAERWIAYTTLAAQDSDQPNGRREISRREAKEGEGSVVLVPAGELVVERAGRGGARRIGLPGHFVIAAAWSPTDDSRIAYTFSTGSAFGAAVADVVSGDVDVVRESGLVAEELSWSPDGRSLDVYAEGLALVKRTHYSVPLVEERRLSVSAAAEAVVKRDEPFRLPRLLDPMLAPVWLPNEDSQPFRSELPGGFSVVGDNVLGLNKLYLLGSEGQELAAVNAIRMVAALPAGVLYKEATDGAVLLRFLSTRGQVSTLAAKAAVSYELPMSSAFNPDLSTTQVGQSYSTACRVSSHTGNLAYAYDFQATAGNEAILAAAAGTVVYVFTSVTCNSADTSGCNDYSSTCSSNGGWGNVVILSHADSTYTKYTHLRNGSITATLNKSVTQGCQMALEGHTGSTCCNKNGCGDHLHFQRQGTSGRDGASQSISFSDVASNPLSCTTYNTSNTKVTC